MKILIQKSEIMVFVGKESERSKLEINNIY